MAGIDEVGRGSWAGPVSVGVALLDADRIEGPAPEDLRDSKAYTEARREAAFDEIASWCTAWAVGSATNRECDGLGMTAAVRLAARRALTAVEEQTGHRPDRVLLDGSHDFLGHDAPTATVVRGDQCCAVIAAASVLAKVTRDRYMRSLDADFPPFDFGTNKGYPSPTHRVALAGFGPTAIHRTTWAYMDGLPWLRPACG